MAESKKTIHNRRLVELEAAQPQINVVPAYSDGMEQTIGVHGCQARIQQGSPKGEDPNTCRSAYAAEDLKGQRRPDTARRDRWRKRALEDGAAWAPRTHAVLRSWKEANLSTDKPCAMKMIKRGSSRLGAKAVNEFERIHGPGEALVGKEADLFRATTARAN